jgi:hypothetical protein
MPTPTPMASDNWPFFIPNQHQAISPVVLVPQQTVSASVNSYDVNNLIMSSQQRPQSLMTSDELHRKVDQQIKQHWSLLGDRQPVASPPMPLSTSFTTIPPHHHHHSHSTSSSPNQSITRKKNVCFNDSSSVRRYSVDDLDISCESTPLKSCLKSPSPSATIDERRSPIDVNHNVQTQTIPASQKARPKSAVVSSNVYRSSTAPQSVEHWHARQLKSAPGKK